jgi:UDP-2,3-diacylglucosamine hydrolase
VASKTVFISDLHLEADQPKIASIFFQLLKDSVGKSDALYILGDFFESWIGDDDVTEFNTSVIHALKSATDAGLPIYFMHGNRDFLIGKQFLAQTGCQFLSDETVISLYGTPVLLMHGDTLCTLDIAYQKTRKKLRQRWLQTLFLCLPLAWRKKMADKMRASSMKYVQTVTDEIMDVTQDAVLEVMKKHDVKTLIHGHTHKPAIHTFTSDNQLSERIVLGAWHTCGQALVWYADGKKKLVVID